ncbi:zf-HC2 domain-containing protein [Actinomadura sp. 21ATH]|uniref:zf-HC2 domain-containing protein n=1 Tax=Actinomadura sp. 21ATH TaxID=1735444 RepID=UPI0035C0ECDD
MRPTDCGDYRIGLGVYALGRLAEGEADELRDHLAGCGRCRGELAELRGVVDLLARTRRGAGPRARARAGASFLLVSGGGACAARAPGR